MGFVKEPFRSTKDKASSAILRRLADKHIRKYGRVEDIAIDSSRKTLEAKILLRGETETISLRISRFEIIREDGYHNIVVHGVSASREWIDTLARDYLENRAIRISSSTAHALTFLV